jgi:hypothetical protein
MSRSKRAWTLDETITLYQEHMLHGDSYSEYPEDFLAGRTRQAIAIRINLIRLTHERKELLKVDYEVLRWLRTLNWVDPNNPEELSAFMKFMMIDDRKFAFNCATGWVVEEEKPEHVPKRKTAKLVGPLGVEWEPVDWDFE